MRNYFGSIFSLVGVSIKAIKYEYSNGNITSVIYSGTRMTSKCLLFLMFWCHMILISSSVQQHSLHLQKQTLLSKASPFGLAMGYGLTVWQYYNLIRAIVTTPDFENSRWILY